MRIVFFGTPDYVLPILNSLHKTYKSKSGGSPIVAVVTQKPRPAGRKQNLAYSPVDSWAHKKKLPIYYNCEELMKKSVKADIGILAAYGKIVPFKVIDHFPHGILNIHPSLLPKFRGASPVQAAIVTGEKTTGVTIIKLDEELDHGPIISQFKIEIQAQNTTETLRKRCFEQSAEVLITLLPTYIKGKITPRVQDHKKATYTILLKKEHGFIPTKFIEFAIGINPRKDYKGLSLAQKKWEIPFIRDYFLTPGPYSLERFIRAMQPWPISWTYVQLTQDSRRRQSGFGASATKFKTQKRIKILKAHIEDKKLVLDMVQLEGKNPISWEQFRQGYPKAMFE